MTDITNGSPTGGARDPGTSADEIRRSVQDAGQSAKSALSDVKARLGSQGGERVDTASTSAGESLRAVADQLRQAGDGLGEDQGWAKQAFTQGAQGLERVSGYLREGNFDTFAKDIQSFARSNPAAFLAGSVALGFLAARVAKTAAEHASTQTSTVNTPSTADNYVEPDFESRSFSPSSDFGETPRSGGAY